MGLNFWFAFRPKKLFLRGAQTFGLPSAQRNIILSECACMCTTTGLYHFLYIWESGLWDGESFTRAHPRTAVREPTSGSGGLPDSFRADSDFSAVRSAIAEWLGEYSAYRRLRSSGSVGEIRRVSWVRRRFCMLMQWCPTLRGERVRSDSSLCGRLRAGYCRPGLVAITPTGETTYRGVPGSFGSPESRSNEWL